MGAPGIRTEGGTQAHAGFHLRPGRTPGSWQVGGPDGPTIAAISFGDRTEALALAARSPQPTQVALAHLRALALRGEGLADAQTLDLAVLDLAAAEVDDTLPSFAETALCVARGAGLGLSEIAKAPAAEIDAMARALFPMSQEDGTTRIVFAVDAARDVAGEIEARLQTLLRRVAVRPTVSIGTSPAVLASEPVAPAYRASHAAAEDAARVEPPAGQSDPAAAPPAGPRPFRLAPAAVTARAAAERSTRARTLAGASGSTTPGPSTAEMHQQPPVRATLSLVPLRRPEPSAAPRPTEEPFPLMPGWESPIPSTPARPSARTAALAPASIQEWSGSTTREQQMPGDLRLSGQPGVRSALVAAVAEEEVPPTTPSAGQTAPHERLVLADVLAAALEDEADLRGLAP